MLAAIHFQDYWTFWDAFFIVFICIPLVCVRVFAIVDDFTWRDLSGWDKAGWLMAIVIPLLLGTLFYLIFRPWYGTSA
jgi:hypothetical protein